MIQDRSIKAKAIAYAAAKRWLPQVEVDVLPAVSISATRRKPVTDIDVMFLVPDPFKAFQKVLVDCKTRRTESPIARSLWLSGLMRQVGAEQGVCVLRRSHVEEDHRFYASRYGILLLTEDEFDQYALLTGASPGVDIGHVGLIERWESFFAIPQRFPRLEPAVTFARSGYWQSQASDNAEACRKAITAVAKVGTELDPAHAQHRAVLSYLAALFLHSLAGIVTTIFAGYLRPETKEELNSALLLLLYGGREAYQYKNTIARIVHELRSGARTPPDLSPPNWSGFVQLVRTCLDAPLVVAHAPLLMTEMALRELQPDGEGGRSDGDLGYAVSIVSANPQVVTLGVLATEYLVTAARLPTEFAQIAASELLQLLALSKQPRSSPTVLAANEVAADRSPTGEVSMEEIQGVKDERGQGE